MAGDRGCRPGARLRLRRAARRPAWAAPAAARDSAAARRPASIPARRHRRRRRQRRARDAACAGRPRQRPARPAPHAHRRHRPRASVTAIRQFCRPSACNEARITAISTTGSPAPTRSPPTCCRASWCMVIAKASLNQAARRCSAPRRSACAWRPCRHRPARRSDRPGRASSSPDEQRLHASRRGSRRCRWRCRPCLDGAAVPAPPRCHQCLPSIELWMKIQPLDKSTGWQPIESPKLTDKQQILDLMQSAIDRTARRHPGRDRAELGFRSPTPPKNTCRRWPAKASSNW